MLPPDASLAFGSKSLFPSSAQVGYPRPNPCVNGGLVKSAAAGHNIPAGIVGGNNGYPGRTGIDLYAIDFVPGGCCLTYLVDEQSISPGG